MVTNTKETGLMESLLKKEPINMLMERFAYAFLTKESV